MIISRNVALPELKQTYKKLIGSEPRRKITSESYNAYRNFLVNKMLEKPNVELKFGERVSKNKPSDRSVDGAIPSVGRPRTTGRERVCEVVKSGANNAKVAAQNYECKAQDDSRLSLVELRGIPEDSLRRITTALIPSRQRSKKILEERYQARRGVLNDLSREQMLDLLQVNGINSINQEQAFKILKHKGRA